LKENQVSLTSIMTAYIRAYHSRNDTPKIFDDFLAYDMIPQERRTLIEQGLTGALQLQPNTDQGNSLRLFLQSMGLPQVISRSRYAEDHLELACQQGVKQYVILGAGMDTFAFRRPELLEKLRVLEIDHPATQAFKCDRLAELGWEIPANLSFVPMDFSKESLSKALMGYRFDPQAKSFFSWLGVTMYLTQDEVFETLRSITEVAPAGSTVLFDYFGPDENASHSQETRENLQKIGEPIKTYFDPSELATQLSHLGLRLMENLSPAEIQSRYFQGRTDGYVASKNVYFARAMIEPSTHGAKP